MQNIRALLRDGAAGTKARLLAHFCFFTATVLLSGCAGTAHRVEFEGTRPIADCPDEFKGLITVSAESLPIALPGSLVRDGILSTDGQLARRIVVSVAMNGALRAERITWSRLSLSAYGGTFVGWTDLQTPFTVVNAFKPSSSGPLSPPTRSEALEAASVEFSAGQIKVMRSARGKKDLSGAVALDVIVLLGGVEVDDTVLRVTELWATNGATVAADAVKFELVPVRHPPGYDIVDADLVLEAVVRIGKNGDEWSCTAESRVTLVDQEAIRQPLWDIGIASANGRRGTWLALSDPAAGIIRLIFESPSAAGAFASWLQMTRATRLGHYSLGVFEPPESLTKRSFAPIDSAAMQTFRPLAPGDFAALKIGALGES